MNRTGRLTVFNAKTACLGLITLWAYAFWPTIAAACHAYVHSSYDYQGFLAIPILLILMHHQSANLKRGGLGYNAYGLLCILLGAFAWLLATIVNLDLLCQLAILSILIAIIFTTCGKKVTTTLYMPLACLLFLLPVGASLNNYIQHGFAWLLMQAFMLGKQAVYWEGHQIVVNNYTYDMAAYLSGMKHVLSYAACGACFAMLRAKNARVLITMLCSCIFMPLVILWLALYSYILLSTMFSNSNIISNHITVVGWCLTAVGLLHAFILGIFISDKKGFIPRQDNIDWRNNHFTQQQKVWQPLIFGGTMLLLMPFVAQHLLAHNNAQQIALFTMPNKLAAWQGQIIERNSNHILQAKFNKASEQVHVTIAQADQKIGSSWAKIKAANKTVKLSQQKLPIQETVLHNDKNKYKILWKINYVNGHFTNSDTVAQALKHFYTLSSTKGTTASVITISTDATAELSFARERLKSFLQDFTASDRVIS
ncbi:MAG TPA: exosortase-associated EpsI family protein [Gammaproteobacteria bacterium]|nr:exosortase-associated EpsI family protein [Gammaproteobacteria bacterium]